MFCIINLRHNSTHVAPPAAGGPPFFSTHSPPPLGKDTCIFTNEAAPALGVVLRDVAPSNIIKRKHRSDVALGAHE